MNWTNIHNLIPKAAAKRNFATTMKAINICREYRSLAKEHLPKDALDQTKPSYKDTTLTIGVYNSSWSQQLNMKRHIIQDELNKKLGKNTIKKVRIRLIEEDQREEPALKVEQ